MAAKDRTTGHVLIHRLLSLGHRFSFFQAVQLLERYSAGAARIGHQGPADSEAIRLRPDLSLSFPGSDIISIEKIDSAEGSIQRFRITASFLGLYGTVSPLPTFYTEDMLWNEENVRDFLDIFHHRLFSLFYRCWSKYRYYIQFKHAGRDDFSRRMLLMIGLDISATPWRGHVPAIRFLRYAGLLTAHHRSAAGLEAILSDYFDGLPVRITQCVDRWVNVKPDQCNAIGQKNCELGRDLTLGARVFDRSGKFRISLGPVRFKTFVRFLPEGDDYKAFKEIVQIYMLDKLAFDVEVKVLSDDLPLLCLSTEEPVRLGWTSWLLAPADETVSVIFN